MDDDLALAQVRVGRTLNGQWRLDSVLGVGGMAAVYRAVQPDGSAVAVKMLHPEISADAELRERFLREGYAANRIPHDGVLKVLGDAVDQADGAAFLVMELLDGEALDARLERKGGSLPRGEVLAIGASAADALCAAHQQGVLHRDIKPDNLFLTRDGRVKILDFGLARLAERQGQASSTREGAVLGTPAFMSPEHAMGRWSQIDARADVWSLGATLFTLLTGKNVHEGATPMDVLVAAATKPARSLAEVAPQLGAEVASVIDRAVAFRPEDRYPDMASFKLALDHAVAATSGDHGARPSIPDLQLPMRGYFDGQAIAATMAIDPAEQARAMQKVPSVATAGRAPLAATVADPALAAAYLQAGVAPQPARPAAPGASPFRMQSYGSAAATQAAARPPPSSGSKIAVAVLSLIVLVVVGGGATWWFVLR